jgi:hypothetical protein
MKATREPLKPRFGIGAGVASLNQQFCNLFLLAPVKRVMARIDRPSQSRCRICARACLVSVFILISMLENRPGSSSRILHYV